MTAVSSQKLADALRLAGFDALAKRAELNEFHDFKSPHDMPAIMLDMELLAILSGKYPPKIKKAIRDIRHRFISGEFDASDAEWVADGDRGLGSAPYSAGSSA